MHSSNALYYISLYGYDLFLFSFFAFCLASCFWYKDLEIHISNYMNLTGQNDVHTEVNACKCTYLIYIYMCTYRRSFVFVFVCFAITGHRESKAQVAFMCLVEGCQADWGLAGLTMASLFPR